MAQLDNFLIQLFHEGNCLQMYKVFGAHLTEEDGVKGVRFTVYAPNARSVQVVGEFNQWNGTEHVMEKYTDGGIYTLFIPKLKFQSFHYSALFRTSKDFNFSSKRLTLSARFILNF